MLQALELLLLVADSCLPVLTLTMMMKVCSTLEVNLVVTKIELVNLVS